MMRSQVSSNSKMAAISLAAVLVLTAVGAAAQSGATIVGPGELLVKVESGAYGELFPTGVEASADSMVLALDTFEPHGRERRLVPGTASIEAEDVAAIHYERGSDRIFILWESLTNVIHPALSLTSFNGRSFTEPLTISGNPFARKSFSQLAINRDVDVPFRSQFELGLRIDRTLLGVAWVEEAATEMRDKRFQGLLLHNGVYTGLKISFDLTRILSEGGKGLRAASSPLDEMLSLQVGDRANTSNVGFYDPFLNRVVSLEIELLPMPLSLLVNQVSELLLMEGPNSATTQELAAAVAAAMQEMGEEFHPGSLQYMIERVQELILEHGSELASEVLERIYDKLGPELIMIGYKVRSGGLEGRDPIAIEPLTLGHELHSNHHVSVALKASWEPPPDALIGQSATLHLSRSGREALIAWDLEHGVRYLETVDGDWSRPKSIAVNGGLDHAAIRALLVQRIENR